MHLLILFPLILLFGAIVTALVLAVLASTVQSGARQATRAAEGIERDPLRALRAVAFVVLWCLVFGVSSGLLGG